MVIARAMLWEWSKLKYQKHLEYNGAMKDMPFFLLAPFSLPREHLNDTELATLTQHKDTSCLCSWISPWSLN
jgi:hypothetical protein